MSDSNETPQPPKPPKLVSPPRPPRPPVVVPSKPTAKSAPVPLKKDTVRVTLKAPGAESTAPISVKIADSPSSPKAEEKTRRIVVPRPSEETSAAALTPTVIGGIDDSSAEANTSQTVKLQHTQPLKQSGEPAHSSADIEQQVEGVVAADGAEASSFALLPWAALSALLSLLLLVLTFSSGDRSFSGSANPYEKFNKETGKYDSKFEEALPTIPE